MMNIRVGCLVSALMALLGCSNTSTELGRLPGSGGRGADANLAADGPAPDSLVQGTGGVLATGGILGTGGSVILGTGGGASGTGGAGGTRTTSTTTPCATAPSCNWCGGKSSTDGRGCVTGYRCANGVDPCVVMPCSASSCRTGESCGADQLCWPSGGTGGKGSGGTGGVRGTGGAAGAGGSTGTPVRVCGSVAGIACQSGEFCEYSAEGCKIMDSFGVCSKTPTGCPKLYQPVCGCDGKTYDNDCFRQSAGMSKSANGACGSSAGSDGGVATTLTVSPPSADFSEGIGLISDPVAFTVTNTGEVSSGELRLTLTGASQAFEAQAGTCVAFLPAGQTCQVSVRFKAPTQSGTYSATLGLTESGGAGITAVLSGYAFPTPGGADASTECPERRPSSDSGCTAAPNTWCSYFETGPTQYSCTCSSSRWTCSIASP